MMMESDGQVVPTKRTRGRPRAPKESTVTNSRTDHETPIAKPVSVRAVSRRPTTKALREAVEQGPLTVTTATAGVDLEVVDLGGYVWDRLTVDGETDVQFAAFRAFLGMKAWDDPAGRRTLDETAKLTDMSRATIGQWASRFNWAERSQTFDEHMHRVSQKAHERQIERVAERRAALALKGLDAAEIAVVAGARGYTEYAKEGGQSLSPDQAFDALKAAATLVKDMAGQVVPPAAQKVNIDMGGKVEVDVAAELRALLVEVRDPAPGTGGGTPVVLDGTTTDPGRTSLAVTTRSDAESPETTEPVG